LVNNAPRQLTDMSDDQISFGLMIAFAASTIIAWLATRYDWGRKSRY